LNFLLSAPRIPRIPFAAISDKYVKRVVLAVPASKMNLAVVEVFEG
jgi:hypothetical protein